MCTAPEMIPRSDPEMIPSFLLVGPEMIPNALEKHGTVDCSIIRLKQF